MTSLSECDSLKEHPKMLRKQQQPKVTGQKRKMAGLPTATSRPNITFRPDVLNGDRIIHPRGKGSRE